jgi:phosphatidylinositol-3-phosphatase
LVSRALFPLAGVSLVLSGLLLGTVGVIQLGVGGSGPAVRPTPSPAPTATPVTSPVPTPTPAPTGYDHIVVIVLENHSFETVIGSPQAPFLNSLANQWGLATGYSGVSHPSLPNYLALIGGSTFGISSDCTDCFVNAPSLPDRLEASGKTWKAYMEGMPSPCFVGSADLYAQKHNPFVYFDPIRTDPARCSRIVPYDQLAGDFATPAGAPNFAFITPNLCNDGHDCPLSTTDAWLASEVPALLSSPAFTGSRSLLAITYDEGEGGSDRVATILAGSGVKQGFSSAVNYNHYSLLRTIESLWGLSPLAAGDGGASPMSDFFLSQAG